MDCFDYIIVGAGSAGCVMAERLTRDPARRVLLVEAGGDNQTLFIRMAGGFMKIMGRPDYFWSFPVEQKPGRRREVHSYGKGLGGSSAVNGTWYLRGQPRDFDGWRDAGLDGWGWDEIGRCYSEMESYLAPGAHPARGSSGPLEITPSDHDSSVFRALITACTGLGVPWLDDICTPGTQGVGRSQYTVDRQGRRASSYEAFLAPVRKRGNLAVMTGTQVRRVTLDGRRATGVEVERDGEVSTIVARREVIVSAGVYKSPQLLQLSGIGAGQALSALGLGVTHDLPAVGANLCDHQKLGISYDLENHPGTNREFTGWRLYRNALRYFAFRDGPLARVGMPLTMLMAGEGCPQDWPDMQLAAAPFAMRTVKEMVAKPGSPISDRPGLTISGYHLRPWSRGRVTLHSNDFRDAPLIDSGLWSDERDIAKALELLRLLRAIAGSTAMKGFAGAERVPGADLTDDAELIAELRNMVDPGLHGTGTCAMGTDAATSVVDARCRVHGITNLRVVDCSIMPTPVSGNTNGPAMAVAARAAELVEQDGKRA